RSVIATPAADSDLPMGEIEIAGTAWSGAGRIQTVELSVDGARTWQKAQLGESKSAYSATPWRFRWKPQARGQFVLACRAIDEAGNTQPTEPVSNTRGYGNNVVHRVPVRVVYPRRESIHAIRRTRPMAADAVHLRDRRPGAGPVQPAAESARPGSWRPAGAGN